MFDKFSDAAEKLASSVSRRHFLGSIGRWAGAAALGVAGFLVPVTNAQAGNLGPACYVYRSSTGQLCGKCWDPGAPPGWQLVNFGYASNCKQCWGQKWGRARCPF
jgi:hypothetical protein